MYQLAHKPTAPAIACAHTLTGACITPKHVNAITHVEVLSRSDKNLSTAAVAAQNCCCCIHLKTEIR
jgi:hypothetical protein